MTTSNGVAKRILVAMAMASLAACGGAGKGGGGAATGPARVTVSGAVRSTSAGLNVNGVTFRTAGASLRMPDDSPTPIALASEDTVKGHLDDGMVVTVKGRLDDGGVTGQAESIEFRDAMEGAIDDKGADHVTVLGQPLSVDDTTHVEDHLHNPKTLADLSPGMRVEISGHGDARGGARATFIRIRDDVAAGTPHEAKGYVVAMAPPFYDLAFTRGGPAAFTIDVSAISPAPVLAIGDLVEATFAEANPDPNGDGKLDAIALEIEQELEAEHGEELEVEGIVSSVSAPGFTVAGQAVVPNADATWSGGTADDLVVGVEIEVEGTLGDDGVLHASELKFEASVRIDGNVGALDAPGGSLSILGVAIHVTPSTELRGGVTSLADLALGDRVEIRGTPTSDGTGVNASRLELLSTSPSDRAFLRAAVTAKTPTTGLTMLGLAIDVSAASFQGVDGSSAMAANAFFDAIVPGKTLVKVRWRPYPASPADPVDEAELEN
jgi:hypothetical protein